TLFVEAPTPYGFWSPFSGPPFGQLRRLKPFQGVKLLLRPNRARVDLGEVKAGIQYGKVVIDLAATLEKVSASPENLKHAKMGIKDIFGHVIYEGNIPETALDLRSSTLKLALTKGKWSLHISLNKTGQVVQLPSAMIRITSLSCIRIRLGNASQTRIPCD